MKKYVNDHITVCSQKWLHQKGSMSKKDRDVISKALKYCHGRSRLDTKRVRDKLKDEGMNAIVIKGHSVFACIGRSGPSWSTWNCGSAKFTIFCTPYRSEMDNITVLIMLLVMLLVQVFACFVLLFHENR